MPTRRLVLYLLDAHSLIYQVFHAIPAMTGPKGQPTNAVYGFTGDLLRLRKKNPDYLVCVFDAPGKTFRDEIYTEYKAQRAPMPPDLVQQLAVIRRVLEAMRVPVVEVPGFEADDAIATIATQADARGLDVLICTGDKDCRQLISDRIKLYNVRKDQVLDRAALAADWGIAPEQVVDLLSLVGDSVDNVPGVPGVGIKTAQKLLAEFGSVEGILANLDKIKGNKIRENLKAGLPLLERARRLVLLDRQVPLACDWEAWRPRPMDVPALLALFQESGFHRYANEVRAEAGPAAVATARERDLFDMGPDERSEAAAPAWQAEYRLARTSAELDSLLVQLARLDRVCLEVVAAKGADCVQEILGIAFSWKEGEAWYVPTSASNAPGGDSARGLERLRPILEDARIAKIGHDLKRAYLPLLGRGTALGGVSGDAMLASYLLASGERNHSLPELALQFLGHPLPPETELVGSGKARKKLAEVEVDRLAQHAMERVDAAARLVALLEPRLQEQELDALYHELEVPLIEVLVAMEHAGIRVDLDRLKRLSADFRAQMAALEQAIHAQAGRPFNIASPKQLRQVLFEELRLPTQKRTSITGEASTSQDVLEELAAQGHELPRLILEHRQLAKLTGTYVDALPGLVNPRTGRVHASFNQTVAATGRLSSSDPNLQNIPVRTEQGRQIRQAFVPGEPGWVLLAADYSQIELRVLAHFSSDPSLERAFAEDRDIHAAVASQIYGVPEAEVTEHQRRNAKTVNFGVIYGLSAFGLAGRLGISREEATAFIDAYFARYAGVAAFQKKLLDETRRDGYLKTILGRRRAIEGIRPHSTHRQRNQAEREALNTVIQGSAADLIKRAMLNIRRRLAGEGWAARMLLQIHDELVLEVPAVELDAVARLVAKEMTCALELRVPLKVDLAAGPNWLDVQPMAVS